MAGLLNPKNFEKSLDYETISTPEGRLHRVVWEAEMSGMEDELNHYLETFGWDRMGAFLAAKSKELGVDLSGEDWPKALDTLPDGIKDKFFEEHYYNHLDTLDDFAEKYLTYSLPSAPVVRGFNEIMNKSEKIWTPDAGALIAPPYNHVHRTRKKKLGEIHIIFRFEGPPNETLIAATLLQELGKFSTETVDVFEILLAHYMLSEKSYSEVTNEQIAKITPPEIAAYRRRLVRGETEEKMQADLMQQVKLLSELRLTMRWNGTKMDSFVTFGDPIPARLFNIEGWTFGKDGKTWTAFTYSPGHALTYFYNWKGRGHRALLRLDPYHHALAKKIGRYLSLIGVPAAKRGLPAGAKIETILRSAGEDPDSKKPGRMVKQTARAFNKLLQIGYLVKAPDLNAIYEECQGDYQEWLNRKIWVWLPRSIAPIVT